MCSTKRYYSLSLSQNVLISRVAFKLNFLIFWKLMSCPGPPLGFTAENLEWEGKCRGLDLATGRWQESAERRVRSKAEQSNRACLDPKIFCILTR